jgi:hypothetical protein
VTGIQNEPLPSQVVRDGDNIALATPGLIIGRIPIRHSADGTPAA